MRRFICSAVLLSAVSSLPLFGQASQPTQPTQPAATSHPVIAFVYERARGVGWDWFEAPPYDNSYGYGESLLRFGFSQNLAKWDWKVEITQPTILDAPNDSVSANTAQGQLGLGASYYAANGNNSWPVAAFLKQGFIRYDAAADQNVRIGRIEWVEGVETKPKNPTLAWLQPNRVAQRLVGNFGFTVAQRSFDGIDAHYGQGSWDITTMFGRADQGVFNMNGNPELNVDIQYLAYTKSDWSDRFLWRVFAIGYHDGRTGLTKPTTGRPQSARQTTTTSASAHMAVIFSQSFPRAQGNSILWAGERCKMGGGGYRTSRRSGCCRGWIPISSCGKHPLDSRRMVARQRRQQSQRRQARYVF